METIAIPNVRCVNCNKPVGHLYLDYQTLITMMSKDEAFKMLGLLTPCCRKELEWPNLELVKPAKFQTKKSKLTSLDVKTETINLKSIECVPISYQIDSKKKHLNDELYVSYVTNMIFLAK